jgi:hypothetical protein
VKDDLGTSGDSLTLVLVDGEGATSVGLPSVLLVLVALGDDGDSLGDKVSGVESDTELTDHRNVSTSRDGLHECLSTRLGDGSEIVDELGLGHTNTRVPESKGIVGLIWHDLDAEVGLGLQLLGLSDGLVAELVESVRGVGNELSQEDLLVGVESVDDQGHQLLDVSIESKDFFRHVVILSRKF